MTFSRSLHANYQRQMPLQMTAGGRASMIRWSLVLGKPPLANLLSLLHSLLSYFSCGDLPMDFWMYRTSTFKKFCMYPPLSPPAYRVLTSGRWLHLHFTTRLETHTFTSAYFIGSLTYSGWIFRKFGYRWTFITGLCISGVGALLFWSSGMKRSFYGFYESMFIVGFGLSTLETSANLFIATCGKHKLYGT